MPQYIVHLAITPYEPFPPLQMLPMMEADDPLTAADQSVVPVGHQRW